MKKIGLFLLVILAISACSQSKTVYFNGADGSNSGIKYESTRKVFSLN